MSLLYIFHCVFGASFCRASLHCLFRLRCAIVTLSPPRCRLLWCHNRTSVVWQWSSGRVDTPKQDKHKQERSVKFSFKQSSGIFWREVTLFWPGSLCALNPAWCEGYFSCAYIHKHEHNRTIAAMGKKFPSIFFFFFLCLTLAKDLLILLIWEAWVCVCTCHAECVCWCIAHAGVFLSGLTLKQHNSHSVCVCVAFCVCSPWEMKMLTQFNTPVSGCTLA